MGGFNEERCYAQWARAALADGDAAASKEACESAISHTLPQRAAYARSIDPDDRGIAGMWRYSSRPVGGPMKPLPMVIGYHRMSALVARAYVAMAQGEPDQAERDGHEA